MRNDDMPELDADDPALRRGYWYMASPYSRFPGGIAEAAKAASCCAAYLLRAGIVAYSPVAHTHSLAVCGGLDPYDHSFWLPADWPLMDGAAGIIVAKLAGWRESVGVAHEVAVFRTAGKPMFMWTPPAGTIR